jgi:predicted DNA-binding protein (MmcQ/YjbR family)
MLGLTELKARLAGKPSATAGEPFGPGVIVYKVAGKMFAIVPDDAEDVRLTLKCDPVLAEVMRGQYAAITPGYHTDKRHWITIRQDAGLPDAELKRLIDRSYDLVRSRLTGAARAALERAEAGGGR